MLTALLVLSCIVVFAACSDMPTADGGDNGDDTTIVTPGDPDEEPETPGDPDAPHEHTYTGEVSTQPTCTQEGEMTYTCTCGDSYTESIPMTAHNYAGGACTVCGDPEPEPTEGLVFELSDDGSQYSVTGYTGTATEVYIPAVYKGLPVTSIGNYAFSNCNSLTSITISDNVIIIGWYAFSGCSSLTSITISDGVTIIGVSAFEYCDSLISITIPDSVTSIGYAAFSDCSSLTSVTFEDPEGWYRTINIGAASGTDLASEDLSDPSTAAEYLTDTYGYCYWYKR